MPPTDHTELETRLPMPRPSNCKPMIWWLGIAPPCTTWDEAAAIFERKCGYAPNRELSFRDGAIWHVGPMEK